MTALRVLCGGVVGPSRELPGVFAVRLFTALPRVRGEAPAAGSGGGLGGGLQVAVLRVLCGGVACLSRGAPGIVVESACTYQP